MRVLQLISSTGYYGAESVVATLAEKLPAMGVEAVVGHIRYGEKKVLCLENHLRNCEVIPFEHASRFELGIVQHLRKELKRRRIDAIHSHGYKPDFYGGLAAKL